MFLLRKYYSDCITIYSNKTHIEMLAKIYVKEDDTIVLDQKNLKIILTVHSFFLLKIFINTDIFNVNYKENLFKVSKYL